VAYLASLTEGLPRRPVIDEYIRIVKDKSLLRRLMLICSAAIARAADQGEAALEVLGAAEAQLMEVSEKGLTNGFQSVDEIVQQSFGTIDNLYKGSREVTGLATDFREFDRLTSGLQKGELIIIAARPSMGKTAFAINIAQNAAINHDAIVAVFSLEMSKESLLRRMLSSQAWVDQDKLRKGFLGRDEQEKLQKALNELIESRIFIDDTAAISLAEMRARARRLKHIRGGLDLIVVDYLQLMTATVPSSGKRNYENRTQEVSGISRGLKALAKELGVPVVALSQLSRAGVQRKDDKRPMLSDLRESGSIEQDADVVAFIHRESYYKHNEELSEDEKAKSEIIIEKQRNGPTGTIYLNWLAPYTRFENQDSVHKG
jgi:replicative DNA helicase